MMDGVTMLQEKKARVLEKFREGCSWEQAAAEVEVSRMTVWRWSQADPEFASAIEEAKAGPDREVEAVTFINATDSDPAHNSLRMFWLKSRMPHKYKDRFELSGNLKPSFEQVDDGRDPDLPTPGETA